MGGTAAALVRSGAVYGVARAIANPRIATATLIATATNVVTDASYIRRR
jgi:hypothetical protein